MIYSFNLPVHFGMKIDQFSMEIKIQLKTMDLSNEALGNNNRFCRAYSPECRADFHCVLG